MPTGYGEILSSLQGMDEAGPVPKRHGRSVCLWPRFEGALLPMGDLSGSLSGPASRIFPMLERRQISGLLRFVPVPAASPVPRAAHQGLRFPERHAKGAYSKKIFAPPVKSFSERPVAIQMQQTATPLRGRPGVYTAGLRLQYFASA